MTQTSVPEGLHVYVQEPSTPQIDETLVAEWNADAEPESEAYPQEAEPVYEHARDNTYEKLIDDATTTLAQFESFLTEATTENFTAEDFRNVAETAQSGWAAFRALVEILGGRVKDEKAVAPTEQGDLLGADVEVAGDPLVLRTKDERRAKIAARIDEALRTDQLAPADAGSLAGTCTFMSTTTFGKVGRKDIKRLHQRQHSARGSDKLNPLLRRALLSLRRIVQVAKPRCVYDIGSGRSRRVVYSDAQGAGGVGAVVFRGDDSAPLFCRWRVPARWIRQLRARKNQVEAFEALAAADKERRARELSAERAAGAAQQQPQQPGPPAAAGGAVVNH